MTDELRYQGHLKDESKRVLSAIE